MKMHLLAALNRFDAQLVTTMRRWGVPFLRYSLATVFLWFGLLKLFFVSPVVMLISLAVPWFDPIFVIPILGVWECAIGLGLLFRVTLRATLLLFWAQMAGTFLVLVLHPEVAFQRGNLLLLTMEGEFIIKNLVLISAGLVIGSTARSRAKNV